MLVTKDEDIKKVHRKRLEKLSKKSIGKIPQQDHHELNEEQKQWIKRKTWRTWDND